MNNFESNSTRPDQNFASYHLTSGYYEKEFEAHGENRTLSQFLKHLYTKVTDETKKPFQIMAALNLFKKAGKVVPAFLFNADYEIVKIEKNPFIEVKNELKEQEQVVDQFIPKLQYIPLQPLSPLQTSNRKPHSMKLKDQSKPKNLLKSIDVSYQVIQQFTPVLSSPEVIRQSPQAENPNLLQPQEQKVKNQLIYEDSQYQVIRQQHSQQPLSPQRRLSVKDIAQQFLQNRKQQLNRSRGEQKRPK